jgi:hypothetical protein
VALRDAGHGFGASGDGAILQSRLCCNWRATAEDVAGFLATAVRTAQAG